MATTERFPNIEPDNVIRDEMSVHFLEQMADNPDMVVELADRLWNALSSAQKDRQTAVLADFFPDDMTARENAAKAQLVNDYCKDQAEVATSLQRMFDEPDAAPLK